ncbi:MAG: GNAT family N-acetyltransferase [Pseudomonadota bacterium]
MTPEALAKLHARCFSMPRPWRAKEFSDLLTCKGVFLKTCESGFVLGRAIADEVELLTLAVAPTARRQGIGTGLLDAFESTARCLGASEAFLEVAEDNAAARALYARCGFRQTGRRSGYYLSTEEECVDALLLGKSLIPAAT